MKMLRMRDNIAILISAIESVQLLNRQTHNYCGVIIATRQIVFRNEFDTDEAADEYFLQVLSTIENSNLTV